MPTVCLNAATSGPLDALLIPLLVDNIPLLALLDSGSTDSFVHPEFIRTHGLQRRPLSKPLRLRLFDGSETGIITEYSDIKIRFPCGTRMTISFLLTPLDQSYSAVLGHRWLARCNPLIDWLRGHIQFKPHDQDSSFILTGVSPPHNPHVSRATTLPTHSSSKPDPKHESTSETPKGLDIRLINAHAFNIASKSKGSWTSLITFTDLESDSDQDSTSAKSASAKPASESGINIPSQYHEFLDVFSKKSANQLPPHRLYDLKIELEEGSKPPWGPIYSLSEVEQVAL